MSMDIFKSCVETPKSGKIFWNGQGKVREFLKVGSAGHPVLEKSEEK